MVTQSSDCGAFPPTAPRSFLCPPNSPAERQGSGSPFTQAQSQTSKTRHVSLRRGMRGLELKPRTICLSLSEGLVFVTSRR